ncbi:hypothetical protein NXS98_06340 [Fontisphaera persica]|uniref:hypothetical protein n=1 Tax=Fontisphaera persica TaxID=2974023 RepID=UPI0024BF3F4C|nr:hypothetical protein [Fontisphaera persica]WCJ60744.1 hypothetical protein NXS98_06340 [Fontisphaera persica]
MKHYLQWVVLLAWLGAAGHVDAASGKLLKVLPHYLDLKGRHSLSPSLYDRDAYQAYLREKPEERSGLRFDIQYRVANASQPRVRVELRAMKGGQPQTKVLEMEVKKTTFLGRWASVAVRGEDYKNLGEISAWRVTLWDGNQLLGERKSFLWPPDSPVPAPVAPAAKP